MLRHQQAGKPLVDVRSPGEFTGELLHMPDYPQEGALRGGHIPGAVSIPWAKAANEDGTFKQPRRTRKALLPRSRAGTPSPIVAYCRIGERSSHTWFVLKYLLGFGTCAITTARGPNGAIRWACRSSQARARWAPTPALISLL